jgi:hypothetical protein
LGDDCADVSGVWSGPDPTKQVRALEDIP